MLLEVRVQVIVPGKEDLERVQNIPPRTFIRLFKRLSSLFELNRSEKGYA